MNNNPSISFPVEGNRLLMYIRRAQITPAVLCMDILKNPGISQSLLVIFTLVLQHSQVHPMFSRALQYILKLISHSHGTPVPDIRHPSYSQGQPECLPRVWNSPEDDTSKFRLHILSDIPGGSQWLKYILQMMSICPGVFQTYAPDCWVHHCSFSISVHTSLRSIGFHYPCMSVCPPPATPCQTERWWWSEIDFCATIASKCISQVC